VQSPQPSQNPVMMKARFGGSGYKPRLRPPPLFRSTGLIINQHCQSRYFAQLALNGI